jgi:hypothetical protein
MSRASSLSPISEFILNSLNFLPKVSVIKIESHFLFYCIERLRILSTENFKKICLRKSNAAFYFNGLLNGMNVFRGNTDENRLAGDEFHGVQITGGQDGLELKIRYIDKQI